MGDRFLRSFLRLCSTSLTEDDSYAPLWPTPKLMDFERADLEHADVSVEEQPRWMEGQGDDGDTIAKNRFDLMVRLALGKGEAPAVAVVVEFKIEAKEGKDQTDRYAKALSALLADEGSGFKQALGVFVDFSRNLPNNAGFLPLTLGDLVTDVILPVLKTGSDILHPDVSSVLRQYCQAVEEESGEVDPETARFIKEHRLALGLLRLFLRWSPSLDDLVLTCGIPDGSTVRFRDTKTSAPVQGRIRIRGDRAAIVLQSAECGEEREYFSVSRAAAAVGRRTSYNGWVHWYYQDRALNDYRREMSRERGPLDEICAAIVSGRQRAVERLIKIAEAEGHLPARMSSVGRSSQRTTSLLTDLVCRGYLQQGQRLLFRKDDSRFCEVVTMDGATTLKVGDRYFDTPSGASAVLNGDRASSGFADLFVHTADGVLRSLGDVRAEYQDAMQASSGNEQDVL